MGRRANPSTLALLHMNPITQAEEARTYHLRASTMLDCNGDGVVDRDTDDERLCPTCSGLGFVPDDDDDHEDVIKTSCDLPHSVGGKP